MAPASVFPCMPPSLEESVMNDTIRVNDQWYVNASSARADSPTQVLKQGETFALFDRLGDIQPVGLGEQGLYHEGTRYLSRLELDVDGQRPLLLNSAVNRDNQGFSVDLTVPASAETVSSDRPMALPTSRTALRPR